MNEQELAYIGSFDPYEEKEFETILIRITDGITGLLIEEMRANSLKTIHDFLTQNIAAHHVLSDLLTISIISPERQRFWNITK